MVASGLNNTYFSHVTKSIININPTTATEVQESTAHVLESLNCTLYQLEYETQSTFLLRERFIFVVVFGGTLSLIGIFTNSLLFKIFASQAFRKTYFTYLMVLSIFDVLLLINYIVLISFGLCKDYFESIWLHHVWYFYLRPMFTFSRITQTAQTFLIVATTMERFVSVCRRQMIAAVSPGIRSFIILFVIGLAIASRVTTYWELDVAYTNCTGFASIIEKEGILRTQMSYKFYKFYVEPIIQTYIPFCALFFLNVLIIWRMRLNWHRSAVVIVQNVIPVIPGSTPMPTPRHGPAPANAQNNNELNGGTPGTPPGGISKSTIEESRRAHRDIRDATLTTAGIVTGYLIANCLHVYLSFLEQTGQVGNLTFYVISADVSSFVVAFVSTSRLPVYWVCNSKIRRRINDAFKGCSRKGRDCARGAANNNNNNNNNGVLNNSIGPVHDGRKRSGNNGGSTANCLALPTQRYPQDFHTINECHDAPVTDSTISEDAKLTILSGSAHDGYQSTIPICPATPVHKNGRVVKREPSEERVMLADHEREQEAEIEVVMDDRDMVYAMLAQFDSIDSFLEHSDDRVTFV